MQSQSIRRTPHAHISSSQNSSPGEDGSRDNRKRRGIFQEVLQSRAAVSQEVKLRIVRPIRNQKLFSRIAIDTTSHDRIVGIETLNASKKIDLKTILSYTLELD